MNRTDHTTLSPFPLRPSYHQSMASNRSPIPTSTSSSLSYQSIFDNALEEYKKKTKEDLRSHPLLSKLESCHSPDAVLSVLSEQISGFNQSRNTNERLTKWLNPTVNVLHTFSEAIGGGINLVNFATQDESFTI